MITQEQRAQVVRRALANCDTIDKPYTIIVFYLLDGAPLQDIGYQLMSNFGLEFNNFCGIIGEITDTNPEIVFRDESERLKDRLRYKTR